MSIIKFRIESELHKEYEWVLGVFAKYIGFECVIVTEGEDILVAEHGMGDIQLSHFFRSIYSSGDYHYKSYFRKEPLHYTASNKPDHLSSCFYLLSYLQEYTDYVPDKFERFPYDISLQKQYDCVQKNLVAEYFDALYACTPKLKELVNKKEHKTKFFLTHDIDSVYGALGDNYAYLLKKGNIAALMQLILNHYLRTPDYLLLDKIMDIEDAHDVRSTFFWIVNYGMGNKDVRNADYRIDDPKIKRLREKLHRRGYTNALHKSINGNSYETELKKLGDHLMGVNRNHYLQIELPQSFDAMEKGGIVLDSTMGFAEVPGFRNNYGLPVRPFNIKEKRSYKFLEVPLTIMDTTLKFYLKKNSAEAEKIVTDILEANRYNAIITVLWHNNYFFDHADTGWITLYKTILQWIKQHDSVAVTPAELIYHY